MTRDSNLVDPRYHRNELTGYKKLQRPKAKRKIQRVSEREGEKMKEAIIPTTSIRTKAREKKKKKEKKESTLGSWPRFTSCAALSVFKRTRRRKNPFRGRRGIANLLIITSTTSTRPRPRDKRKIHR